MFLKSLDIFGFKSFADRTHIDFSDGITALLGPNGCGKSNVVDSIKWVLAENRSKNLRADKMEDIIFNGTERRPPLNVAEVTLTIMNENGLIPFEAPEIAIKRRLYRSGENEYFINNRQAGPKEIRSLFMDTGIGKAAYSVMEQGKIDQVLSSKPEDRRYLFEEAAGISRSKAECAEAERELERTRSNLQQIEIALSEIKRRYDTLKVQSEKTVKYRAVKDEIFNDELDLTLLKLKNFVQTKAQNEEQLKQVEKKRSDIRNEIEAISNTLSENMDKVKAMQEEVYAKQADLIGIQKEKSGKQDLIQQFNVRLSESKEKLEQLEAHKKAIGAQIDALNDEIDEKNAQLYEKTKQLDDIKKNIASFDKHISDAGSRIEENDTLVSESQMQIEALREARTLLQKDLTAITEDIVTKLDAKLKGAGFSENAMKNAKERLDNVIARLKIFTAGRKNIFADFAASPSRSADECVKTVKEASDAFFETGKLVAELEKALDDYMKASPAFITEFLAPEGIMTKKRAIDQKISDNRSRVAQINERIAELHAENESLSKKIDEYKETLGKLKVNEAQMHEQITAAEEQVSMLRRTLVSQQKTLSDTDGEIASENKRAENLNAEISGAEEELSEIEKRGLSLADELKKLDNAIAACNTSVSGKQNALRQKQEEQNKLQAQYERVSLLLVSSDTEIKNVKQNFQDTHSRDLMEFEERMYKITKPASEIREKLSDAKEKLKALGQVNLMAVEEFAEEKERYERQQTNCEDTKKSLENLQRVSGEIKSKSSEMFLDTYNKIKKNFHNMFRRLFNGGRAELRLIDPENVLTSGIDIYAQPPGKKLENIALLSGGEKTMTAVALLFATYQVRPSPFCLLDEIDAALDDKNVSSFVTTLRSFANVSQYIVITHNKKTVMGATTMLGITMEESGVSKILSLRLDKDIKLGAVISESNDDFIEEDVPPEEATVPPRPAKRIHNPDGTITDPDRERAVKEEKRLEKEAAQKAKAAEKKSDDREK